MKTFIAIIGTIFVIPSSVLANTTGFISNNSIFNLADVEAGSQQPTGVLGFSIVQPNLLHW